MATKKESRKSQPASTNYWKNFNMMEAARIKRAYHQELKSNTAIVNEVSDNIASYFNVTPISKNTYRIKGVGARCVALAQKTKADLTKVLAAIKNKEWTTLERLLPKEELVLNYTPRLNTNKAVL